MRMSWVPKRSRTIWATASASYKPAKLETGLQVMIPQFIEVGTVIKIDTRDDSYLERAG